MSQKIKEVDVLCGGAGVTSTALAKVLSENTNVTSVVVIEKNGWVAEENSSPTSNSQTQHDGTTETQYSLEAALKLKPSAIAMRNYCIEKNDPDLFIKVNRMALGTTEKEVTLLKQRYLDFKPYFQDLYLAGPEKIKELEPNVMKGRDPQNPIIALATKEGFVVNYQRLAEHYFRDSLKANPSINYYFNTRIQSIRRDGDGRYAIETKSDLNGDCVFIAKVVFFGTGPYSLFFAQQLGYGLNLGILSVAGSFYSSISKELVNGKIYPVQDEGMPWTRIHADIDILNGETRFGPTTKPLPLMERHHYKTFWDYIKLPTASIKGIKTTVRLLAKEKKIRKYIFKHFLYDLPAVGKWLFLKEIQPIIPTIKYSDIKLKRGVGGIRPQIINLKTGKLDMDESTINGQAPDKLIFCTTPSPGASKSLGNAKIFAEQIVKLLGEDYWFDKEGFEERYEKPDPVQHFLEITGAH